MTLSVSSTRPVVTFPPVGAGAQATSYIGQYTQANLPAPPASVGLLGFAVGGRKVGETAGNGTGVFIQSTASGWNVLSTDAPVTF